MLLRTFSTLSFVVLFNCAFAIEWDARTYSYSLGAGYAGLTEEGFGAAPIFDVSIASHIPLLVEQHLRATPLVMVRYGLAEGKQEVGANSGNFYSGSFALLIEHDFKMGDRIGWYGFGPQMTASYVQGQFTWQNSNRGLTAVAVESSPALAVDVVAKVQVPISSAMQGAFVAQLSPMSGSVNAISAQLNFKF